MSEIHPKAPHHLPGYIPGPDGSDPLFTLVVVAILLLFLAAGVIYFKLHSLPEHMGAKANSTQLQLISILAMLALFTHNNAFWVLALLIAAIRVPDYLTPVQSIARSLARIAAGGAQPDSTMPPSGSATGTHKTSPQAKDTKEAAKPSEPEEGRK